MRIHLPRKDRKDEPIIVEGLFRELWKVHNDLWQLKITVPELSVIDNLYIGLSDEEIACLKRDILEGEKP